MAELAMNSSTLNIAAIGSTIGNTITTAGSNIGSTITTAGSTIGSTISSAASHMPLPVAMHQMSLGSAMAAANLNAPIPSNNLGI